MTNLISTPQGFLVPSRDNPNILNGEVSFIHHQGQRLFSITLDGKILPPHSGVPVISVYLHKLSEHLEDYCWYSTKGKIIINRMQTSAFFLPKEIIAEIPPEEIFVKGIFTMPYEKRGPLFCLFNEEIIPLSNGKGLRVFSSEKCFEPNHSYSIEGKVIIPYGHCAGTLALISFKELNE